MRIPSGTRLDRELALLMGFFVLPSWSVRCDGMERLLSVAPDQTLEEAQLMLGLDEESALSLVRELPRAKRRRKRR
jgi:hypothetical protein